MDRQSIEYTEELAVCMERRRDILLVLRTLADKQTEAAGTSDIDTTLGILARKESLLEDLAAIVTAMRPYQSDDPEQRVWASAERRAACAEVAKEGDKLLQEIMQVEQTTIDTMTSRREAIAAQLQNGTDSTLARNAYATNDLLSQGGLDIGGL